MTDKRVVFHSKLSKMLVYVAEKIAAFLEKVLPQYNWWNEVLKNYYRKDVRKIKTRSSLEQKNTSENNDMNEL